MPIYHFDYRDNGTLVRDRLGTDIDSLGEARTAAVNVLVALAHERWERSESHNAVVEVRSEGQVVLQVVLTLEVRKPPTGLTERE